MSIPLRWRGACTTELQLHPCQPKKSIDFICHVMGEDWYKTIQIKKRTTWCAFFFGFANNSLLAVLLVVGIDTRHDFFLRFFRAEPAFHLHPFAGFEILVVLEEVLNLVKT
jgi:hypothetical protein